MFISRQTTPRLSCAPEQGDGIARSINAAQEKCQTAAAVNVRPFLERHSQLHRLRTRGSSSDPTSLTRFLQLDRLMLWGLIE